VEQLPEHLRPAIIGAQASPRDSGSFATLTGYPVTATTSASPQFHFDREVHFGFRDALSYQIVVNWVIAEHKSQGLFQTTYGQNRYENFWAFAENDAAANGRIARLFEELDPKSNGVEPIRNAVTAK
jgi:N-acetylglucosamine malate deacetylase 2